jgi:hypothetical protein
VEQIGKGVLLVGLGLAALGVLLIFAGKIPWIGRLPGDIVIESPRVRFYFPLATSLIVSVVLSLLFYLFRR